MPANIHAGSMPASTLKNEIINLMESSTYRCQFLQAERGDKKRHK